MDAAIIHLRADGNVAVVFPGINPDVDVHQMDAVLAVARAAVDAWAPSDLWTGAEDDDQP